LKEKLWVDKKLEGKRKLKYYKEVINTTLANQNYLYASTSAKKTMNKELILMSFEVKPEVGLTP